MSPPGVAAEQAPERSAPSHAPRRVARRHRGRSSSTSGRTGTATAARPSPSGRAQPPCSRRARAHRPVLRSGVSARFRSARSSGMCVPASGRTVPGRHRSSSPPPGGAVELTDRRPEAAPDAVAHDGRPDLAATRWRRTSPASFPQAGRQTVIGSRRARRPSRRSASNVARSPIRPIRPRGARGPSGAGFGGSAGRRGSASGDRKPCRLARLRLLG